MLDFMSEKESSWEKIINSKLPVVIYGMGNGADKVIDELNRLNVEIKGVTASDAFVRGQMFRGFKVKKLSEFDGDFIIAVAFASSIPDVMNHIYSLSNKYDVIVPVVPVYESEILNREFIKKNSAEIEKAYSFIEDESKHIFAGCIDFMFSGKLDILNAITSSKDEIFNGIFKPSQSEDYLDLGAYKGDTIDELLHYTDGFYNSITALEPDEKTFKKLCIHNEQLKNCESINKAVYSETGEICFDSAAGRQSSVSESGKLIKTVSIDDLNKPFSYIKMDVEGSEYEALSGGINTLKKYKPKLNIALYHRSEDIFKLPILIKAINPEYKIHLRKHPYIPCWDMNLYCI